VYLRKKLERIDRLIDEQDKIFRQLKVFIVKINVNHAVWLFMLW